MIRNLVFDLGGVIIPIDTERAIKRFETLGDVDARKKMGAYGQTDIYLQVENGTITADEFCKKFSEITNQPCTFEQAQWAWLGFMNEIPVNRLHKLLELKEKYNMYLLSNTNPFIMSWAETSDFSADKLPLPHYFHKLYCSYRMKDYKPAKSIFLSMLSDAAISANQTLFIDDSSRNTAAAESVGIHSLLVPKDGEWDELLENKLKELS